jgi:hydroxyacylglutathione hydrolase
MPADDGALVVPVLDEGLGNSAYVVDLGNGRALVVDAPRDLRAVHRAVAQRGLRVAFAADTHLHADFLTGARQLAATGGARILASAAGHRDYTHHRLDDEGEVDLGGLTLRALGTPGHTDEHLAFLLLDGATPLGVFTGGSLIVGSAARTDLVAPERTEELARAQYRSLRRLARLDDEVAVWPTHGAGSFCSAPSGGRRTSTIGAEKAANQLLAAADEDSFVRELLGSLGSFPPYFLRLAEENRRGPAVLTGTPRLPGLHVAEVQAWQAKGGQIVDVRPAAAFSAGHPEGALSIPLRPVFASWLGWLAPHDRPLVVLRESDQDLEEVVWQAAKIGYDNLVGELAGGIEAWQAAGAPVRDIPMVGPETSGDVQVLDVRQDAEYVAGHVPGARHVELGELGARLGKGREEVPDRPTVVMCGYGERAMGAASMLARAGHTDLRVLEGGPQDWVGAHHQRLEEGR